MTATHKMGEKKIFAKPFSGDQLVKFFKDYDGPNKMMMKVCVCEGSVQVHVVHRKAPPTFFE